MAICKYGNTFITLTGLGNFDLTGDGIPDIKLVDKNTTIPNEDAKETNALGEKLVYYKAGSFGEDVTIYLKNGTSGVQLLRKLLPGSLLIPNTIIVLYHSTR